MVNGGSLIPFYPSIQFNSSTQLFIFIIIGNGKQLTIGKMYCVKLIILKYRRSKGKQSLTTKKEVSL